MINAAKISSKLMGLVGFRQPYNPALPTLTAANLESRSGLIINDNPLVKIDFLKNTEDYIDLSDADFNTQLENKQKDSIISVCNSVFNKKSFLEQSLIYRNAMNKINTESLPDGFVGYEIEFDNVNDVSINIKRVLMEFSGTGNVDLLLYNSASKSVLKTKTINVTSDLQEVVLDWTLDNTDNYFQGSYFVGYISTGLSITPFKRDYEKSNIETEYNNIDIRKIIVNGFVAGNLFDLTKIENTSLSTGLNLDISIYKDFSNIIIQNENLFAQAILLDIQISCLSQYLAAMTSNKDQRNAEQKTIRIIQEIEGQQGGQGFVKITGLRSKLIRSIDDIREQIENLTKDFLGERIYSGTLE